MDEKKKIQRISNKELEDTLNEIIKKLGAKKVSLLPTPTGHNNLHSKWFSWMHRWLGIVLLVVFIGGWFFAGILHVFPGERALVLRFGDYNRTYGEGFYWTPPFIDKVYVFNTNKLHSIRVHKEVLSSDAKLVVFKLEIDYKIIHGKKFFFQNINALTTLRGVVLSAVYRVANELTFKELMHRSKLSQEELNARLATNIKTLLAEYNLGVVIHSVDVKGIELPDSVASYAAELKKIKHGITVALQEISTYQQSLKNQTKLHKQRIISNALAFEEAKILAAEEEMVRFHKLAPMYKKAPHFMRERLYLDVLDAILSANGAILLDMENIDMGALPVGKVIRALKAEKKDFLQSETRKLEVETEVEEVVRPLRKNGGSRLSY